MNRSVAVAHDDYTVYYTCRCVSHCQQARDCPLTVVENSAINTNTAKDLSPQDLLNVTAHTFWHSPDTLTLPLLPNLNGVCLHGPSEYTSQI